jgi:hypothetical protein
MLLLLWMWAWVLNGPHYQKEWDNWVPALYLGYLVLLLRRILLVQRARKFYTPKPRA